MNAPDIITLGQPTAPNRYRITVEPVLEDEANFDQLVGEIEVRARTRWNAMALARQAGYVVRTCELMRT